MRFFFIVVFIVVLAILWSDEAIVRWLQGCGT